MDPGHLLAELERRVSALERNSPDSIAVYGPRDDLDARRGVRVRIGRLSDGSYGIERFAQDGTRTVPTWA
ncbi:MAG: hypothetical protein R3C15_15410 [Thermoleophilia bacterium]